MRHWSKVPREIRSVCSTTSEHYSGLLSSFNVKCSFKGLNMAKFVLRKRSSGFTTLSNNVIAVLKDDVFALGLYVYLLSLPDNWEFYKTELCSSLKCGIKKLEQKLKRLKSHGLVQFGQERNEKGQFERFTLDIFDTETPICSKNEEKPVGQNCRTVKTVRRFQEAIKEVITKKEKNKQKREPLTENPLTVKRSLSVNDFKTKELLKLCKDKNLNIDLEIKKFLNYYEGKEISIGKFENWLLRANHESKPANDISMDSYVKNMMQSTGWSEEETREYYRQQGFST